MGYYRIKIWPIFVTPKQEICNGITLPIGTVRGRIIMVINYILYTDKLNRIRKQCIFINQFMTRWEIRKTGKSSNWGLLFLGGLYISKWQILFWNGQRSASLTNGENRLKKHFLFLLGFISLSTIPIDMHFIKGVDIDV